ncbi:HEAT repeat domain-containing protein [Gracilibacillus xinjiangensis]|uniref:HEAT repeat domain-containing protein n=1 Tax=Gracilibacillus xinjiangensis TaxID=1193282 RepID=A0ABV8WU97_9BACI
MIKQLVILLAIGIAVLCLLLFILTCYVVSQRWRSKRQCLLISNYITKHADDWFDYLINEKENQAIIKPTNKQDFAAVEEILIKYIKNVSSEELTSRITMFANLYLVDYYQKKLRHLRSSVRLNTLYRIIDFRMDRLYEYVAQMIDSKKKYTNQEYIYMYKIAIMHQPERIHRLLLHSTMNIGEYEYRQLLLLLSKKDREPLFASFDRLPVALRYALINAIGEESDRDQITFLERLIDSDDSEMRIRSLKAISTMGTVSDLERYMPIMDSNFWEERLMLAKIFNYFPVEQVSGPLQKLLTDKEWWVRYQAAKSLGNSANGKEILHQFIQTTDDPYGKEMANNVLQESY